MKIVTLGSQPPASKIERQDPEKFSRSPAVARILTKQDDRLLASEVAKKDPDKFKHSLAVGRIINTKTNETGTAFRVGAGNRMLTNAHVLSSGNPQDYRIDFTDAKGRITSVAGDKLLAFSPAAGEKNPRPDISTRQKLDFALFSVKPSEFAKLKEFGYLEIDVNGAKPGQEIYIPQHGRVETQDADGKVKRQYPKTIVLSDDAKGQGQPSRIDRVHVDKDLYPRNPPETAEYSADTLPGASGAPVISADSHQVVALHSGSKLNAKLSELNTNHAMNMPSIWQLIKGFFSDGASNAQPGKQAQLGNLSVHNTPQDEIGDRRDNKGVVQELWKNPGGGLAWVDVWQLKNYPVGAFVVKDGKAYSHLGTFADGPQWAPVFDPNEKYQPDEQVYHQGKIVNAKQLGAALAHSENT